MILSVILGVTIDTPSWIEMLREDKADYITVVDYNYTGEPEQQGDVLYLSPEDAKVYMKKFDSVEFFTSFYCFPGMSGEMSSLYKGRKYDAEE